MTAGTEHAGEPLLTPCIDAALARYLSADEPAVLWEAMRYSVFAGGKRLRPQLLIAACLGAGGTLEKAMPFACAVEMIHTYSLIHDDLPAMDDDDLRRGRPTNHKVYGEAMAILAGDGLLNRAYEIMSEACGQDLCWETAEASRVIAAAAGGFGMVAGQAADILSENKSIAESAILYIHANKTAALIRASILAGGILGGADAAAQDTLARAGEKLGLAFQIKDDLDDITESTEALGKPAFSDLKNNKATYVSILGTDRARRDYSALSAEAKDILRVISWKNDMLPQLAAVLWR